MTEAELLEAGLGRGPEPIALLEFADPSPEDLEAFSELWRRLGGRGRVLELRSGPVDGVPVGMHAELRELRELVEAVALQVAVLRELAELTAAILGVELEGEGSLCDDCGRADGTHADGVEH